MPRYFFNVHEGATCLTDRIGTELADETAARIIAADLASQTIHHLGERFWEMDDGRLEVCDEAGKMLFTLRISARHEAWTAAAQFDETPGLFPS